MCLCAAQAAQARRVLPSLKSRAPTIEQQRPKDLPSDAELERLGARIGEIRFDARKLFDAEAADDDTSLSRLANRLHITTRQATIEDQLLFKSGDLYRAEPDRGVGAHPARHTIPARRADPAGRVS